MQGIFSCSALPLSPSLHRVQRSHVILQMCATLERKGQGPGQGQIYQSTPYSPLPLLLHYITSPIHPLSLPLPSTPPSLHRVQRFKYFKYSKAFSHTTVCYNSFLRHKSTVSKANCNLVCPLQQAASGSMPRHVSYNNMCHRLTSHIASLKTISNRSTFCLFYSKTPNKLQPGLPITKQHQGVCLTIHHTTICHHYD